MTLLGLELVLFSTTSGIEMTSVLVELNDTSSETQVSTSTTDRTLKTTTLKDSTVPDLPTTTHFSRGTASNAFSTTRGRDLEEVESTSRINILAASTVEPPSITSETSLSLGNNVGHTNEDIDQVDKHGITGTSTEGTTTAVSTSLLRYTSKCMKPIG